ncbi:MAG TPA: hypothetical protein VK483_17385 [Chitinophagaceae bacterium]|nr:hypothetical protein [Chitinophagaceae bacterium]
MYDYILNENNSLINNIRKSFSVSFATSESDTVVFGKLKPGTGLGLGIRCVLINTKPDNEVVNNLKKWMESEIKRTFYQKIEMKKLKPQSQQELLDSLISITEAFKKGALSNQSFNGLPYSYASKIIDEISMDLTSKVISNTILAVNITAFNTQMNTEVAKESLAQTFYLSKINSKVLPLTRQGFMLEFGAGYASVLQDNEFNGWQSSKLGLWLTPSWRWNTSKDGKDISLFDFMGVVRYTINNKKDSIDIADYFDAGVKGQFTSNKWSGSLEFISRWASKLPAAMKSKYTYRLALGIDYKISDALTFKFTFGSNFDGNTSTYTKPKEMFAIGGLNLGIFNPKAKENK